MTVRARELASALVRKGFVEEASKGDHDFYYLNVDGKITDIRTKISKGAKIIEKGLVSAMRRQMGALEADEFRRFVECPMTGPEYVALLRRVGVIPDPEADATPPSGPYRSPWERRVR